MSRQFEKHHSELLADIFRLRRDVRGNRFIDKDVDEKMVNMLLEAALYPCYLKMQVIDLG